MLVDSININKFNCNLVVPKKKLLKTLNIIVWGHNLDKKVVTMGHTQNKKLFFFTEITKPDHRLSKMFYYLSKYRVLATAKNSAVNAVFPILSIKELPNLCCPSNE